MKPHQDQSSHPLGLLLRQLASLTPAQQTLLRQVGTHSDPITVGALATELGLHVSSVRETIEVLTTQGLVNRHTLPSQGRGRPSIGYTTNLPTDPSYPAEMLNQFSLGFFIWLDQTEEDKELICRRIGANWGDEALKALGVPDHAKYGKASPDFRLENHMEKICLFLSSLGFRAGKSPTHPTAFTVSGCPLAGDHGYNAFALAIRRGLVERVLERTATNNASYVYTEDPYNPLFAQVTLTALNEGDPSTWKPQMTTIRFFGGAAEVAGTDTLEWLPEDTPDTLEDLVGVLIAQQPELRTVLNISSFLVNQHVANWNTPIPAGGLVDVLPPFAGG